MKRIFALLLIVLLLVSLFPVSLVAQAETITKKPFYFLNFDRSFNGEDYKYVDWQPYTWIDKSKFDASTESINIGVYFNGYSTSNVNDAAAELYDEFKNRPEGTRYISLNAMKTVFEKCVKDAVDMEDGVRLVKDWLGRFLDAYKALGGQLDGLNIDLEYNYAYNFYIESVHYNNSDTTKRNRNIYNDIVANKVYKERIRPKLVEMEKQGLWKFYQNPDPAKYPYRSEIWTMYRYDKDGGDATCRSTWNKVIQGLLVEYINEATYEPLIARYPNAILSDYGVADMYGWNKSMSNTGTATGTSVKAGNASDESYYGSALSPYYFASSSSSKTRKIYDKPAGHNGAVYNPETPYGRMIYDVNNQKALLASTLEATPENKNDDHVNVHVAFFNYGARTGFANTPYFTELVYHLGMTNPEPFFGYILPRDVENYGDDYDDPDVGDYYVSLQVSDELMAELTRVAGASDRKAIVTPIAWNEDYILSGMYAGGRNIWRITPNTNKVSLEDFKVKDQAPTFKANGLTITFPQGRIIEDGKISMVGSCGYWVETPANVMPVVTSTADRYANNPSFLETFDGYKDGAFTGSATSQTGLHSTAHADTYWTATGTAEIKNKAITLTGNTTLTNSIIPENITAGDSYAKKQAWAVTVTLPTSGTYTNIKLLDFDDADTTSSDAIPGFLLSGGKVQYYEGTTAKALNVDISAGGTYTFKRVLDFSNAQSFVAGYYVYDNTGKLVASAENIQIAASGITLPVHKISLATTGAATAVLVDDYKLYPVSLAADLEIYNGITGRKIADVNTVRTERTGYRLSWMNATSEYKVGRIYDVKSGKILKKIEMAPGTDGIVSGVVDVEAGKSVQIALDIQDGTAPAQPNYDAGNFRWTAASESLGLATGPKPAGGDTGNTEVPGGDTGNVTPENPGGDTGNATPENPGEGEEGGNIYEDGIVEGTPEYPSDNKPAATEPTVTESVADTDPTQPEEEKKAGNGKMILVIVILAVVALAGAGVAVYIFVIKPKKK